MLGCLYHAPLSVSIPFLSAGNSAMKDSAMRGYTKIPNWLLALLPSLPNPVLRIALVILRESVGWGYRSVTLSLSDFVKLSGLTRSSVWDGIERALKLKIVDRERRGQGYTYRLEHPDDSSPFPTQPSRNYRFIRQVNRSEIRTSGSPKFKPASVRRSNRGGSEIRPVRAGKLC